MNEPGIAKTMELLGIRVHSLTKGALIEKIAEFAVSGNRKRISYINAHCVNTACRDGEYKAALNRSDIVYADGMSVVWAALFMGRPLPQRVNIIGFLDDIFRRLEQDRTTLYLLGGREAAVRGAARYIGSNFPDMKICGFHNGYFTDKEESDIINEINSHKPDILIVGLGVPYQEKWINSHLDALDAHLCLSAGAMFDYISGLAKKAPTWMCDTGLEWLYRLNQEPGRLWRRYLLGNPVFIYRVIAWKIRDLFF